MVERSFLDWPFFDDGHRALAANLESWAELNLKDIDHDAVDQACRDLVRRMGNDGWLEHSAPSPNHIDARLDVRSLCLIRETLARYDGLADFSFAMRGLGAGPITLFGTDEQKSTWLPKTRAGKSIAAFALSEPRSGSDVASIDTTADQDGDRYVINGEKTWISNGGIVDFYIVFARTGEQPGSKGLSAFILPADALGLEVVERLQVIAPHPLARLEFDECLVPASSMIGEPDQGFKIAMATEVDASALLIYRTAWTKDQGAERVTRETAMAKLYATEAAQKAIDKAVQIHVGDGVRSGHPIEELYRGIRALRIYEGASEVQKAVIARQAIAAVRPPVAHQAPTAMGD